MNFSNTFLAKCQALKAAGFEGEFGPGVFVSRGFADLGYELFTVLPDERLLSLFTGKITAISADERTQLFLVPGVDELIAFFQSRYGFGINCASHDGRSWTISFGQGPEPVVSKNSSLVESLLDLAAELLTRAAHV